MSKVGILLKLDDLRAVWKNEERDFSAWLSQQDNLEMLSKEIGIDLVLEEREASVGSFSVDILATEDGTNRKVIIENQLTDTNHDHLGKIITYAAGKNAEIIIWIVKKALDEHRQAIDWLNEHTDEEIGVFLIEIELWQIDDSFPAPKFNVVSKPNDWAKALKVESNLSETKQMQYRFWQAFRNYANGTDFVHTFTLRKARPQHWYDLGIGMSEAQITLTINSQKKLISAEIYIHDDKELFGLFESNKNKIEDELGFKLDWLLLPNGKASRIIVTHPGDLKSEVEWEKYFKWYIEKANKMKTVFN
jgi:hypothetical protein